MPAGQKCSHCEQPQHNIRTCAAYAKYEELKKELAKCRRRLTRSENKLAEANAGLAEDRSIINLLTRRRNKAEVKVAELQLEVDYWKKQSAMIVHSL